MNSNLWTPVSERLPVAPHSCIDASARVLAYGEPQQDGPFFVAYCDLDGNWYLAHDSQPMMKVTHWQELPTPPAQPAHSGPKPGAAGGAVDA